MPKFKAWAYISAGHYLGEYEADTAEEAQQMADDEHLGAAVSICYQCAKEIDEPTISRIDIEE